MSFEFHETSKRAKHKSLSDRQKVGTLLSVLSTGGPRNRCGSLGLLSFSRRSSWPSRRSPLPAPPRGTGWAYGTDPKATRDGRVAGVLTQDTSGWVSLWLVLMGAAEMAGSGSWGIQFEQRRNDSACLFG